MAKADVDTNAPATVWMHQEQLLGYWFSVADECKEDGDIPYVPATEVARVRRETWDAAVALMHETLRDGPKTAHEHDLVSRDRLQLLRAFEAARDESEGQG